MTEPTNCQQCGNPLSETAVKKEAVYCDRCWNVIADYHYLNDYDEFEDEDEIYHCEFCGGEYSYDGGWSTCDCDWRWGDDNQESDVEEPTQ